MSPRTRRQHAPPSPARTPSPLKKGATFHTPTTPPAEKAEPSVPVPSVLPRSQTCSSSLDDLVASREKRMAAYISSIEDHLRHPGSPSVKSQSSIGDLPLPQAVIDSAVSDASSQIGNMDLRSNSRSAVRSHARRLPTPPPARHAHASDSGLGSSVSSKHRTTSHCAEVLASFTAVNGPRSRNGRTSVSTASSRGSSAITRSHSALASSNTVKPQHVLSAEAIQQIRKRILTPILQRSFLKDFHPLLRDIPRRIEAKDILCLRDLEKTLLLLAPERSKQPDLYLNFCETSIHCIQATVGHISEPDQRRPADRPYTQAYFSDLVQQVRHYAGIMAASRNREASGATLNENDYHPSERVDLHGGLSKTGQPAELVRVRDGKKISISTGAEVPDIKSDGMKPPKRSSSHLNETDTVYRSMGPRRRRRVADEDTGPRVCSECNKTFPRNCDLTKHEKTHTRPWKCPEVTCPFHTKGWPTEKECDRHYADKHALDGKKFPCEYEGCDYASKRESNCKQHMEKTHGWTYHRSKNNGKKGTNPTSRAAVKKPTRQTRKKPVEATPQTPSLPTPESAGTPMTNSPYEEPFGATGAYMGPSPVGFDNADLMDDDPLRGFPLPDTDFSTFPDNNAGYATTGQYLPEPNYAAGPMDGLQDFYASQVSHEYDYTQFNMQMPTPMPSAQQSVLDSFSYTPAHASGNPNLSPMADGDPMLFTPADSHNEFGDCFDQPQMGMMHGDFNLFSSGGESSAAQSVSNSGMFPPLDAQSSSTHHTGLHDFLNFEQNTQ